MKKMFRKIFGIVLTAALILTSGFGAKASSMDNVPAEEVFPEEQVQQLKEEADRQPLYYDKDGQGNLSRNYARSTGTYPTRYGVILVTSDKYKGLIPTGHAAIIWTASTVVESLSGGVTTGPNDWNQSKSTCYAVTVHGTTADEDNEASNWCYSQKGKPYNFNYLDVDTRDKFYCSQLVWAAFKDNYGIDLNTSDFFQAVHPMELVNSSNTYLIYQK